MRFTPSRNPPATYSTPSENPRRSRLPSAQVNAHAPASNKQNACTRIVRSAGRITDLYAQKSSGSNRGTPAVPVTTRNGRKADSKRSP